MKVKTYVVLQRAIEEGFRRGYVRAFKHTDKPEEHHIEEAVMSAIMGEICDVFDFDQEES